MDLLKRFKSLPREARNTMEIGIVLALAVALPLLIWTLININLNIREKASNCQVRPACLDQFPHPCDITEPVEGWCAVVEPTPTNPSIGGYVEGEPNSCGGTCGSNYNCKANLYCYAEGGGTNGFCRNPNCSSESDCECSAATTTAKSTSKPATAKSTTKPTSKVSASPIATIVGSLQTIKASGKPTKIPETNATAPENQFYTKYAIYLFAGFVLITILSIYFVTKRKPDLNTPQILPPTNI